MKRGLLFAALLLLTAAICSGAAATGSIQAPAGLTGRAGSQAIELGWQPVTGATSYAVYRGTSAASVTDLVTPAGGVTDTSFTDRTSGDGATYYYAVRAIDSSGSSTPSVAVRAASAARSCDGGNPIVSENCFAGNAGWYVHNGAAVTSGGIEGFATASSINRGGSLDLKVKTTAGAPYSIEIYRSGYYGGAGARLYSTIVGLQGTAQPSCSSSTTTGLVDCSNWATSATITTSSAWPSGVYLARLVRTDTGADSHVFFVVRDDSSHSALLFGLPTSTYQAYNNWGGKSLYDYNSSGAATASGTSRAVSVSFDRPYTAARDSNNVNDWYTKTDYAGISFLERSGYDVTYTASDALNALPGLLTNHAAFMLGVHDEYYSAAMRGALEGARDAGVSLLNIGSNNVYWKIRYATGPNGGAGRIEVCYKTFAGGPADPSGDPTTTWRDPAGPAAPENALLGVMYAGDESGVFFPLAVTAAEGTDSVYRYTGLDSSNGSSTLIGTGLVGWEWDTRYNNGFEPPGLTMVASSPVHGNIVQPDGSYAYGPTVTVAAKYRAPSGALVFSTGTNHWVWGLATNVEGVGQPDIRIQQATSNILFDMGVLPQTPLSGISFDTAPPPGNPVGVTPAADAPTAVSLSWSPVAGATGYDVYRTTSPRSGGALGTKANATLVVGTSFHDTGLHGATTYYYVVTAVARGASSSPSAEVSVRTPALPPLAVASFAPGDGSTGVASSVSIRVVFSRALDAASVTGATLQLTGPSGPVATSVAYDPSTTSAVVAPASDLAYGTTYTVQVTSGVLDADGNALATPVSAHFTVAAAPTAPLTLTARQPAAGATAVPTRPTIAATFSRALDASSIPPSAMIVRDSSGTSVPGTVTYDSATTRLIFAPASQLSAGEQYTVTASGVRAVDGTVLSGPASWSFTVVACPCSLFSDVAAPALQPAGSYELGVRVVVDSPASLTALRFYKAVGETGSHVGSVWSSSGARLAQVTFAGESASGWQSASLSSPLQLQPGVVYLLSVNANARFAQTVGGFASPLSSGVLHSADGANGVFNTTLAAMPNQSYQSSNYYIDGVVKTASASFAVTQTTPSAGDTAFVTSVHATLSRPLDPAAISASTLTVRDASGASVSGSITYDDASATLAWTPTAPLAAGSYTAAVAAGTRAADGATLATAFGWSFTTTACPCSLFTDSQTPAASPSGTYELGLKFTLDAPAALSAIRFYKAPGETGTHTGTLWTAGGTRLARLTFTSESGSGWQVVRLSSPLQLQSGVVYIASVNANTAYSVTLGGLAAQAVSGPLRSVADGANGVFNPSVGDMPNQSYQSSNYFVDVILQAGTVPLALTQTSPAGGATTVVPSVSASLSRPIDPSSVTSSSLTVRDGAGTARAGTVAYDQATSVLTWTPTSPLVSGTYTATVAGITTTDGTVLSGPASWSFTVVACPCSLFSDVAAPALQPAGSYELGVRVTVDSPASLNALRFFKAVGETGTHVGSVWSSSGTRLAQVTFANESASGWQSASLPSSLQLQPGAVYVLSVNANARFAQTVGGFASPLSSGLLRSADGANGVFNTTLGAMPNQSYQSSNYYIDAVVTTP